MADSRFLTGDTHSLSYDGGLELHDIDLIPPSPPHFYDDLDAQLSDIYSPPADATFPQTPGGSSYSPYSSHTELSDDPSQLFGDSFPEYNPSDFDHPSPQYMLFGNAMYGDYSSPSSNGGSPHITPASLSASPRMDLQQSLENMTFNHHSPSWGTEPLPVETRPSPPRLMMPDEDSQYQAPVINAPEGDGRNRPHLNVVPATPVSGGLNSTAPMYNIPPGQQQQQQQSQQHQHHQQPTQTWNQSNTSTSGSHHLHPSQPSSHQEPFQFPARPHSSSSLYIPPTRSRSKSESSPVNPTWDTLGLGGSGLGLSGVSSSFQDESAISDQSYSFSNDFLSPGDNSSSIGLRRSRSDAGGRPGHVRASRSDDLGATLLMPPNHDFLTPSGMNMNMGSGALMGMEGGMGRGRHVRRASSGSRSERGISSHDASPANSNRASPYPSPNVSPHGRYEDLPQVNIGGQAIPLMVSKQNVTTGRTKVASHNRRKQEATFVCPVAGCGSTFTRSFNLKGHIRSHNEEKPFVCPWPGCNKGFARQHDCKRHEQLHSNYRPFACEGCQKPFARMDALNRHLKSEGGTECAKLLLSKGQTLPLTPPKLDSATKAEDWDSGLQL